MKRRNALIAIVGVAVLVAAWAIWTRLRAAEPLEWSGTIEAHTVDVASRVGGRVARVLVREGDLVEAGQPLVELEPGDLDAQREQAAAQVQQALAARQRVVEARGPTARSSEIDAARARVEAADVAVHRADLDAKRLKRLVEAGASAQNDLDQATFALEAADADARSARAQLDQLVRVTPTDVQAAEGELGAAQGRLEQIDVALRELVIAAPSDARVETMDLRPGDLLAPDATAARLLEPGQLFVRIYVPETQLGHVRPGLEVPVYVDSFPDRAFPGVVESVSDVGEFTPRNLQAADERADQVFATKVRLEREAEGELRVGMAATVRAERR